MSIHHEVSVHCDGTDCGDWQWGKDRSTRARRRDGWTIWQSGGHWYHLCPRCTKESRKTLGGLSAGEVEQDLP